MNSERPLDGLGTIKLKLGILVVASVLTATIVSQAGERAEVSAWWTVPATVAGTLLLAQWLARGMTSPMREMTAAATRMATGDYSLRVSATSADEVGELARAFNTMAGDLEATDRHRRELIATVSHELRTPLTAQRALLENLVDGISQSDDSLRTALAQSERLSSLVADLLDLSRLEGGVTPLSVASVDLDALVAQGVAEARAADTRGIRFSVNVAPLEVTADDARLAQVLANLLENAVRHSPPAGTVRITIATSGQRDWYLEVADQGEGIPDDSVAHVFDRFGTGDRAGGTGLGLSIARWICELHGGSITALPSATGARLRAVLPLHPTPQLVQETPMPAPTHTPLSPARPPSASVQPSPVIAPLFGHWWPERAGTPRPGVVLTAVAIGVVAGLLLPHRPMGLGLLLVLLLAGGVVLRVGTLSSRWSQVYAATAVALSLLVVLRAAEWLAVLALAVAGVLLTTALTDARGLGAMIGGWLSWVLAGVRGLPLLGRSLDAMSRVDALWPAIRTLAVSVAALVVFGGLFASGDAIFGSWVSSALPDLNVDGFVERGFVAFVVAGVVLAASYLAINPPSVERLALPDGRRVVHAWEWLVPVALVIATFGLFVFAQAAAMWGGHDYVRRTTGMTYADYVHQGFGQLSVATFLTLLTVAVTSRKAPRETGRDRVVLRAMLGGLCVLALVVVGSALYRMGVYQGAYGYTVLRVLVDAFELWMGLMVVLVLVAGIRLRGGWIPRVALLSGALMVLGIGLANPEGWVAQRNIDRYAATDTVDTSYLATLGPDATPTIVEGLPAPVAACSLATVPEYGGGLDGLLAWNLGRQRATQYVVTPPSPEQLANCSLLAP